MQSEMLLSISFLYFSLVLNAVCEQSFPKLYELRVNDFNCYPKAANAIVSCKLENETTISLNAQLQHYHDVNPLFIQAAVYFITTTDSGQQESKLMFVTIEYDLCQYLNETITQTSGDLLTLLVRQWSLNGNLQHPCPYQEININKWTITDGLSKVGIPGDWMLIVTLFTRYGNYDLTLVETLLIASIK